MINRYEKTEKKKQNEKWKSSTRNFIPDEKQGCGLEVCGLVKDDSEKF